MGLGWGALAYVRYRFQTGQRAFRRFTIAFAGATIAVAVLSLVSSVNQGRCPDDPSEICRYNDSVPAMATVAGVFVIAASVTAWVLYAER